MLSIQAITQSFCMLSEYDRGWTETCACGRIHEWWRLEQVWHLQNATWLVDSEADDEYPEYGHYECPCGARVWPGERHDVRHTVIIGYECELDGVSITKEQYNEAFQMMQQGEKDLRFLLEKWGYRHHIEIE